MSGWQSGSRAGLRVKNNVIIKLSDSFTTAVYIYSTKLEEEIVGVDGILNQAVNQSQIQPFSRISPGEDLRPGLVLQHRTIVCWVNVAGDLVTAKKRKDCILARSMWNHVIFYVRSHNQYLFMHIIS